MASGRLSDEQWAQLARNSARALPAGRFTMVPVTGQALLDPSRIEAIRSFLSG